MMEDVFGRSLAETEIKAEGNKMKGGYTFMSIGHNGNLMKTRKIFIFMRKQWKFQSYIIHDIAQF